MSFSKQKSNHNPKNVPKCSRFEKILEENLGHLKNEKNPKKIMLTQFKVVKIVVTNMLTLEFSCFCKKFFTDSRKRTF